MTGGIKGEENLQEMKYKTERNVKSCGSEKQTDRQAGR